MTDERYCSNCGEIISEKAEICPECGVRQEESDQYDIVEERRYELGKIASKNMGAALLLGFFLSPFAYFYVGKSTLGVVNLVTLNYLLLGPLVVPVHVYKIINDARTELEQEGINWKNS